MFNQPSFSAATQDSDRLIGLSAFAREVPTVDVHAADDIMDERSNPTAQHLDQMITQSTQAHRQQTIQTLRDTREHKPRAKRPQSKHQTPDDFWFMNQPEPRKVPSGFATFAGTKTVLPGSDDVHSPSSPLTPSEQSLLTQLHSQNDAPNVAYGHTKVIQPLSGRRKNKNSRGSKDHSEHGSNRGATTSGKTLNPAILEFANNDDLSVATIARQINKKSGPELPNSEVVVRLR